MTDIQLQALKADAAETINSIDMENLNRQNYLTLGASLAILNHGTIPEAIPAPPTPPQAAPTAHSGTDYERAIDELRAAEKYIADGNPEFAKDELRHAHYWIELAQRNARTDAEKSQARDLIAWHRLLQQKV